MPKNIMTDAEVKLTEYLSEKKYPEIILTLRYYNECETTFKCKKHEKFVFFDLLCLIL